MAIGSTVYVLTLQIQKPKFLKAYELKKLFSCISWEPCVRLPFRFFLQFSLDMWEVWVMFDGYRINSLRFDPPNLKNWVLETLWVEKAVFVHIWRTVCPITIPFLPTIFFRYTRGVSHVSWLSDQRFAFWPSKSIKLNSWKPMSLKSCFRAYLENRVSDYYSVSSKSFL